MGSAWVGLGQDLEQMGSAGMKIGTRWGRLGSGWVEIKSKWAHLCLILVRVGFPGVPSCAAWVSFKFCFSRLCLAFGSLWIPLGSLMVC